MHVAPYRNLGGTLLRWGVLCALLACGVPVAAQNELSLDDVTIDNLTGATGLVRASSDTAIVSVFLSIMFDPQVIEASAFEAAGVAIDAEGVFPSFFPTTGGVVLGLILDVAPPFAGQTIAPGIDLPIAAITWNPAGGIPTTATTTSIGFIDGAFDSPPVTNTITQTGGVQITAGSGLVFDGGTVMVLPPSPPTFRIEPNSITPGGISDILVTLDNPTGPIDAFDLSFEIPPELEVLVFEEAGTIFDATLLDPLVLDTVLIDLDHPNVTYRGTLGSIPPGGETIPLGSNQDFLKLRTQCLATPLAPDSALVAIIDWHEEPNPTPTSFPTQVFFGADGMLANTLAGSVTCLPEPLAAASFFGGALDGSGAVGPISAAPGDTIEYGFFYTDPDGGLAGIQIAACLDCADAAFLIGSFSAIGDQLDESEFLQPSIDSDAGDGDGCEFTLGALLDSLPPFDGATLPITTTPLRLGTVQITIDPLTAATTIPVEFCDGINGVGGPALISNVVLIGSASFGNFTRIDGEIIVDGANSFRRGDVDNNGSVNVADPIAALAYLFSGGAVPPCFATADIDASGTVQVNDPILLLGYLFSGGPPPAAPFPDCATSPAEPCDAPGVCP